jgi:hypothetical protein
MDPVSDRFSELADEILSYTATTREGLALQVRAFISSYSEVWDTGGVGSGVLDFIQSVCAFSGVPFPPYGDDASVIAASPLLQTSVEAGAAHAHDADPIFAVIAEHRAAQEDANASCNASDLDVEDAPNKERAMDRAFAAELPLLVTTPTTVAGVAALLEYVGSDAHEQWQGDEDRVATVISYAHGWDNSGEIVEAARTFPRRVGATLRSLIAGA